MTGYFERLLLAGDDSGKVTAAQTAILTGSLLSETPHLAAEIIAAGAGEAGDEEAVAIAAQLPVSAQVDALSAIADLTFTSDMPPKKLMETVIKMIGIGQQQALPTTKARKA